MNNENLLKKWLNNKFKNKLWSNKIKIKADNKIVEMIIFRVLHDKQIPLLIIKLIIKLEIKFIKTNNQINN